MTDFRNPLKLARNHGAAHAGVGHFMTLRLTAVLMVPLALWLVIGILGHIGADRTAVAAWLGNPINAALMILFIVMACWHAAHGIGEIVLDYQKSDMAKLAIMILVNGACALIGLVSSLAVIKLLLV